LAATRGLDFARGVARRATVEESDAAKDMISAAAVRSGIPTR
jgi:hypothetical protein